jgi:hypothetical protein
MNVSSRSKQILFGATAIIILGVGLVALIGRGRILSGPDFSSIPGGAAGIPADSALAARAFVGRCGDLTGQEKTHCYQAALTHRLEDAGVRSAMNTVENLVLLDDDVARDAHVYAHHIGIEAYSMSPDVAEIFTGCTESFSSGCYHGVIQAYFQDRGVADSASIGSLCEPYKVGEQSRWILFQCVHGMGHGLTMYYGHHLPKALEGCDLLADNWDRQSCYGGAFMENVMAATAPHHPATVLATGGGSHDADDDMAGAGAPPEKPWKALEPTDHLYPCTVMEDRYRHQCYMMQTSVMLYLNGNDLQAASRSCDMAPPRMRPTCHQSLGRDISARTRDPKEAEGHCRAGSELYRGNCYVGVVKAFVDWTANAESGLAFCRVIDDPGHKTMCYRALGEEIAVLLADAGTIGSLCAQAEEEYVATCRRGARLSG